MKLVIDGVSKNFANTHGQKLTVLEDINLTVAEEEFVALVGPSGCGKSTLLNFVHAAVKDDAKEKAFCRANIVLYVALCSPAESFADCASCANVFCA